MLKRIYFLLLFVLPLCSTMGCATDIFLTSAKKGDIGALEAAMANQYNVNYQGEKGLTALMMATRNHQLETVKWLISRGADVNIKDDFGETALIKALLSASNFSDDSLGILKLLLNHKDSDLDENLSNLFAISKFPEKYSLCLVDCLTNNCIWIRELPQDEGWYYDPRKKGSVNYQQYSKLVLIPDTMTSITPSYKTGPFMPIQNFPTKKIDMGKIYHASKHFSHSCSVTGAISQTTTYYFNEYCSF